MRRTAGVHFVRYLNDGNYYGIDINKGLLKAGKQELRDAGLDKTVHLHRTADFDASGFGVKFDFGIAMSLITHLAANHILYCFAQMRRVMHKQSRFYVTFFEVPELPVPDRGYKQPKAGIVTYFLRDPFHYTREQVEDFARSAGLLPSYIGEWGHPRNQRMLALRPSSDHKFSVRTRLTSN